MKTTQKAAGQPAGAGAARPRIHVGHLSTLLLVAEASISLIAAEEAAKQAQHAYAEKILDFERRNGALGCRLDPIKKEHAAAIRFTSRAYADYVHAKHQIYNAKRRLLTAVRRAQGGAA